MKILYLVGKGRSGSTLLDNVLNEVEGVVSTGELWCRWGGRPLEEYLCGCGRRVGDCDLWSEVLARSYEAATERLGFPVDSGTVHAWEREWLRWPRVPRLLLARAPASGTEGSLSRLLTFMEVLYRALAETTEADVVVDSSKWPANPGPLKLLRGFEQYLVHLVRDPRAVASSWRKERRFFEGGPWMPTFGPLHSAASWTARNLVSEVAAERHASRSIRLRYEDLADMPGPALGRILALLGEGTRSLPLDAGNGVELTGNHTVWGNPLRFQRGRTVLRRDEAWRRRTPWYQRAVVGWLTLPLRWRYGYGPGGPGAGR